MGTDREVRSDFQLIAGTNRNLGEAVRRGRFRDDLLARINLWTFRLPGFAQRPADRLADLDRFDRAQLEDVLVVCRRSRSLSSAGRTLFSVSRVRRTTSNDADRLRKYLTRFGHTWTDVQDSDQTPPAASRERA